jgi:hypothetical protein
MYIRDSLRGGLRSLVGAAAVAFIAACSAPDSVLLILIDDDTLPADGRSSTQVHVQAWFDDQPPRDGTRINLATSAGGFGDRQQASVSLSTVGGEASVTWHAPYAAGEVTFTASYQDPYKQQQEAHATVLVVPPPPVDGAQFRFWCAAENVRRPRAADGSLRVPCTVEARDVNGRAVPIDDVRFGFLAEAGRLEINDRSGELEWVLAPGERPKRVEPLGDPATGEPRYFDQTAGVIRNPRDGIATLVVYTRGVPTGQQDVLQGEPYVDENDNGQWDPGEPYFDANQTDVYDGPSGGQEERHIWRWYKVMVTGPVSQVAPEEADGFELWDTGEFARQQINLGPGTNTDVGLLLLDENLNPISSHPGTSPDLVRITTTPRNNVVSPTEHAIATDATGLAFDPLTGQIQAGTTRGGYLQGSFTYWFNVRNDRDANDPDYEPINWRIDSVEVRRRPFPTVSTQITEILDGHQLPRGSLD